MTADASGFQFTAERPTEGDRVCVVCIPAKLNRKRRVLAEFARQLSFPAYFGWNWDALYDCLTDLCGLAEDVDVVIILHRDVPFANSPAQQKIYLSLLQECVKHHAAAGTRFDVLFPPGAREIVKHRLNEKDE